MIRGTALITGFGLTHLLARLIGADRAAGSSPEIARELAERGVLHGKPGAYASTADAAEVSVPATPSDDRRSHRSADHKAKRTLSAASVIGSRFGRLVNALGVEPAVADLMSAQLIDQSGSANPVRLSEIPDSRSGLRISAQIGSGRIAPAFGDRARTVRVGRREFRLVAEHPESARMRAAYSWPYARPPGPGRDIRGTDQLGTCAPRCRGATEKRSEQLHRAKTLLCATTWRVGGDIADTLDSTNFASCEP